MTEPQELRSIDELFKNSFQSLPETPAASGWDTPSDRVWQHIQQNMPAPAKGGGKGWTAWIAALVTGTAVVALGLWWYNHTAPANKTNPVAVPQISRPAEVAPAPSNESGVNAPTVTEPATIKSKATENAKPPTARPKPAQENSDANATRGGAAPLPGSKSASPNTTEERKMDRANKQEAPHH